MKAGVETEKEVMRVFSSRCFRFVLPLSSPEMRCLWLDFIMTHEHLPCVCCLLTLRCNLGSQGGVASVGVNPATLNKMKRSNHCESLFNYSLYLSICTVRP